MVLIVLAVSSIGSYSIVSLVTGKIGVINISIPILTSYDRDYVLNLIDHARSPDVKAVVLVIDSEGGVVSYAEEIYRDLLILRETKPVVASIVGLGVSGSYYIAVASNYIYTESTASVGNVGVIGTLPEESNYIYNNYIYKPDETTVETGPYKHTGTPEKDFQLEIQSAFESFAGAVLEQRAGRLKIDKRELSKGIAYLGEEAVRLGLADAVGSSYDAIRKAAALAGLLSYQVVTINELVGECYLCSSETGADVAGNLDTLNPPPAIYYLYLPSSTDYSNSYFVPYSNSSLNNSTGLNLSASSTIRGTILVDYAHDNSFDRRELNVFLGEAVQAGYRISFAGTSDDLKNGLNKAKALVVISPTDPYSDSEIEAVKSFAQGGGRVLMVAAVTRTDMSAINTLSQEFGIVFSEGYLYDLDENYDNYRDITVTSFGSGPVVKDLKELVFYTATSIRGNFTSLANTLPTTIYSDSERSGNYTVIASAKNVLAISDFAFMTEPYCYVEDNYQLIINIIKFLTQ